MSVVMAFVVGLVFMGRAVAESISDDLACQDRDYGGEHQRRYELQAGRCLYRPDKPRTEEISRQYYRKVDDWYKCAEKCSQKKRLDGGREGGT